MKAQEEAYATGLQPERVSFDAQQWGAVCRLCKLPPTAGLVELIDVLHKQGIKHGLTGTTEWGIIRQAINRCSHKAVGVVKKNYFSRGITVCEGFHDIEHFLKVMGPRPLIIGQKASLRPSLDRVDNNKGYWCGCCPECVSKQQSLNCRWATRAEQSRNTRRNKFVTIDGDRRTVSDWARANGILVRTAFLRISAGWSPIEAVTRPPIKGSRFVRLQEALAKKNV